MFQKINALLLRTLSEKNYAAIKNVYGFFIVRYYIILGLFISKNKKFQIDGLNFVFPPASLLFYGSKFKNYEIFERKFVQKYIEKNDVVIELGGSAGVISCLTNNKLEKKENHIVVEPNSKIIPFLESNKSINQSRFRVEQCIVSNTVSEIELNIGKDYMASSVCNLKEQNLSEKKIIRCSSLDEISNKYGLVFDTLIMDIEGHEYDFLKENSLTNFKKMIIEFHPNLIGVNRTEQCYQILKSNSFKFKEKEGQVEVWSK